MGNCRSKTKTNISNTFEPVLKDPHGLLPRKSVKNDNVPSQTTNTAGAAANNKCWKPFMANQEGNQRIFLQGDVVTRCPPSSNTQKKPRRLNTMNPKQSIDPQSEMNVRNIELNFEDVYDDNSGDKSKELGSGAFGVVTTARHKRTGIVYAAKKIDCSKMKWNERDALNDEIDNLRLLKDGPNIVQIYETYNNRRHNSEYCIIVMECLRGGELFDRIVKKSRYTEKEARNACKCILNALEYMHEKRVAHRDLKPENLLLVSARDDTYLKLADFGFAKRLTKKDGLKTFCGSPGYIAPEILDHPRSYDVECDIWSAGVILYCLIGGYLPFDDDNIEKMFEKTKRGRYVFHRDHFGSVSSEAKDLIRKMLTLDRHKRITSNDALQHEWMIADDDTLSTGDLTHNLSVLAETFNGKRKFKAAAQAFIAMKRMKQTHADFCGDNDDNEQQAKVALIESEGEEEDINTYSGIGSDEGEASAAVSLKHKSFEQLYEWKDKDLGSNVDFEDVHEATHRQSGKIVAVRLCQQDDIGIRTEIAALREVQGSAFIVKLHDVFEQANYTYIVQERVYGGDLLHRIIKRKYLYDPDDARQVSKALLRGVEHMHSKGIVHRNLNLRNILLVSEESDTEIKITDFSCAKQVLRPNSLTTICGTEGYVSPEVLDQNGYDLKCDMWSVGVIIFIILGGYRPFRGEGESLARKVRRGEYHFYPRFFENVSETAKSLVRSLLVVDPKERLSAIDALQFDWIREGDEASF